MFVNNNAKAYNFSELYTIVILITMHSGRLGKLGCLAVIYNSHID